MAGIGIYNLIDDNIVANNINVDTNKDAEIKDTEIEETDASANIHIYDETQSESNKSDFSITFLGELMMGGRIGTELNYNYMSAFKTIAEYTSKADYTVVNLATNVIDLEKLGETQSKYIVTKSIENAFNALGVDGINIASDHMLDFGKSVFNDTINILEKDYDLIGLKDNIVYVEHNGIKVAIIGVCNEVIGTQSKYTKAGIMMYNMNTLKSMIKEAKKNVNTVIMLTHLGFENTHEVTDIMSWFYKELINAGADVVLGSHALGVYPVKMYKDKPIIYSMGNLMSDTDYDKGKESGIFTLIIDEQGKLKSLEILPLYINAKKQTVLYSEYNKDNANKLLNYISSDLKKELYSIKDGKLSINPK